MLQIRFNCTPDYKGIATDYLVHVADQSFPAHKLVLISRSEYFSTVLNGSFKEHDKEITIQDMDPEIFKLVLKTLYQENFEIIDLVDSLEYMLAVDLFGVKQSDIHELHRHLKVSENVFEIYMQYLDKLYPEGFTSEVISLIASKVNSRTDMTILSPELTAEINNIRRLCDRRCKKRCSSSDSESSDEICRAKYTLTPQKKSSGHFEIEPCRSKKDSCSIRDDRRDKKSSKDCRRK